MMMMIGKLGERYSPPPPVVRAEPGRQTHFCAIHSPKSANLLGVSPTQAYTRHQ